MIAVRVLGSFRLFSMVVAVDFWFWWFMVDVVKVSVVWRFGYSLLLVLGCVLVVLLVVRVVVV